MKVFELFEDATIPQLTRSIEVGFPDTRKRQHATNEVRVDQIQYLPLKGNGILRIQSATTSTNGNKHKQFLDLRNVNFESGNTATNATFTSKSGEETSVQPIRLNTTNVGVYCDCEDYNMRFANYNLNNNCHVGPIPPRYVRKTTTRPPANPARVPGMCKHLLKIVQDLRGYGLLT